MNIAIDDVMIMFRIEGCARRHPRSSADCVALTVMTNGMTPSATVAYAHSLMRCGVLGIDIPMLPLPKNRPAFVDDVGGGGFWICDAVGARDWRMEYVRCMVAVYVRVVEWCMSVWARV